MFKDYTVEMRFEERLCGSVPLSKELVRPWLEARKPTKKPEEGKSIEEIEKEVQDSVEEAVEKTTLGFQKHTGVLFVRGGTIKAHLKDCSNQIKEVLKIKALRAKVANKVYVGEYRVFLYTPEGKLASEKDDEFQQPVHVMTPQGPRNALKIIQFLSFPHISFTLKILEDKEVNVDVIASIFEYGSIHGYGGERGMGEGRYTFSITRLNGEKKTDPVFVSDTGYTPEPEDDQEVDAEFTPEDDQEPD